MADFMMHMGPAAHEPDRSQVVLQQASKRPNGVFGGLAASPTDTEQVMPPASRIPGGTVSIAIRTGNPLGQPNPGEDRVHVGQAEPVDLRCPDR